VTVVASLMYEHLLIGPMQTPSHDAVPVNDQIVGEMCRLTVPAVLSGWREMLQNVFHSTCRAKSFLSSSSWSRFWPSQNRPGSLSWWPNVSAFGNFGD